MLDVFCTMHLVFKGRDAQIFPILPMFSYNCVLFSLACYLDNSTTSRVIFNLFHLKIYLLNKTIHVTKYRDSFQGVTMGTYIPLYSCIYYFQGNKKI